MCAAEQTGYDSSTYILYVGTDDCAILVAEVLKVRKIVPCTFLVLGLVGGLLGCSAGKSTPKTDSLNVVLVARSVGDESVKGFAAHLKAGLPEYYDDGKSIGVVGISAGDSAADPMGVMASSTKIASMLASKEIDLWICDPENARRYADNGANYLALGQLFSAEEIGSFGAAPIAFPVLDRDGKSTGEISQNVGIDLSQNTAIIGMTGIGTPHMFVLAGTTKLDAAKAVIRLLAK